MKDIIAKMTVSSRRESWGIGEDMVVCKNCDVELFWNWGGWRHADKPCCDDPTPKRYDKETLQCLKETEEDG